MYKIINAEIYSALKHITDNSLDIAITSPPYWSQRNYGFDEQIGNEPTYMDFISRLVYIFNILKSKLNDKGIFFLNIGDKYLKKYGYTPLGLIPYKLAYFMKKNGWRIEDIIIWHKPNHLPSSVKNRFANSFEPVFVLSKNENNYYNDFRKNNKKYKKVLDINLQPTSFNHIATYPENLVHSLLDMIKIDKDYTVLDPFAGSGTTLKVVKDRNEQLFSEFKANGIMIEFNNEYTQIIINRTKIDDIIIEKFDYIEYHYKKLEEESTDFDAFPKMKKINDINIFDNNIEFNECLNVINTKIFIDEFPENKLLFIGLKEFSVEDIYHISHINKNGWIIRNMIVVNNSFDWYPIFMIIKDNKRSRYEFNYKNLKLNHKTKPQDFTNKSFVNFKVQNNLMKKKLEGQIIRVTEKYSNGFPKYVEVFWKNNTVTKEFIIQNEEDLKKNIETYINDGITLVKEKKEIIPISKLIHKNLHSLKLQHLPKKNGYNGKFSQLERKNWGASPGARSSIEDEYFSMQKLYNIDQKIVADYLNFIRLKNNLSKKDFTELFPKSYKHTIGHWLRKDFGGSIPKIEDWEILINKFDIDPNFTKYVCKTALKLQTVRNTKYKIPEDCINENMVKKLQLLN